MRVSDRTSSDLARKLLDQLDLPEQASVVLGHERYWTEEVCRLYFEDCDEILFEDPEGGLAMAVIAPRLVQMLPASRSKPDLLVHALAILGGAQRSVGILLEAEGTYRAAFAIAARAEVSRLELADLHRRYSNLLLSRGRIEPALDAATRAVDILKIDAPYGPGDYCLGAALVQRGVVQLHRADSKLALEDLGLALVGLDPDENERAYYAALHNLAFVLGQSRELDCLYRAARHVQTAKQMLAGKEKCRARYKLHWVEAALLQHMGSTERAEENLEIAREGFARTGALVEFVLASIDLATLFKSLDRPEDLQRVTRSTFSGCRAMNADSASMTLLAEWQQAERDGLVTSRMLRTIGDQFERLRRGVALPRLTSPGLGIEAAVAETGSDHEPSRTAEPWAAVRNGVPIAATER